VKHELGRRGAVGHARHEQRGRWLLKLMLMLLLIMRIGILITMMMVLRMSLIVMATVVVPVVRHFLLMLMTSSGAISLMTMIRL